MIKQTLLNYWQNDNNLSKLIKSFKKKVEIRFVGGCVRDALLGRPIQDIDFAVSCEPQETIKILFDNDIDYLEYGLDFGTVTAVINEKNYEITSLRKDITTDGRFPKIEFTNNWQEDALRRDFKINSIYLSVDGEIFDPFDGMNDIKNNKISFIGEANARIEEDYLRVMRFYRFLGIFQNPHFNSNEFKIVDENFIKMKDYVSKNRIKKELLKMLTNEFIKNSTILDYVDFNLKNKKILEELESWWIKEKFNDGLIILNKCKIKTNENNKKFYSIN